MGTITRSRREATLKRYYDAKKKGMCVKCTIKKKEVGLICKLCKDKDISRRKRGEHGKRM